MMMNNRRSNAPGFTLVEVIVALAVVAVALPALMFSLHQQIDGTGYLRDKSIAHFIAANKFAELRLLAKARGQLQKGKDSGTLEMAGRQWSWQLNSTETQLPKFYRLEVKVLPPDLDDGSSLYTLVGFLSADFKTDETSNAAGG